jgi:hypothetical protein
MAVITTRAGKGSPLTNAEVDANFDNLNTGKLELSGGTLTGAITLHADPTQALHAASKQYVDEVAEGLRAKPAVRAATTTNLAAVYDNGAAGVGATLTADTDRAFTTLDGVTSWSITTPPMGVLVKNQTNSAHNGRYNLTSLGEAGVSPWVLTRCGLCDEADEIPGAYTFVQFGTANGGTGWVQTVVDPDTFTVGTDAIIVAQFSGAGTYTAGTGLTLTGTTFAMADDQLLPSQTGNNGKFLTTNGAAASWATMTAPNNGTLTLTVAGTGLSGGTTFTADQASNATFTVTSNATSANTVGAIVARDGSGNFTAGTITAALSGNATTATTLQTARTIGGVSFNGSANINLPGVNTAGNQNTTGTAANVTGTVAIANGGSGATTAQGAMNAFAAATTSGQYLRGNGTNVLMSAIQAADVPTLNQSTTGNAATATTLQTARTIGGVSFNGSANINLPGVNTAGNQNTTGSSASCTGNSATATTLQTARTINGTSFNGSANITVTANTTNTLTLGTGLGGTSFNGSAAVTATVSYGTSAGTACQGNDSRLSDSRQATNTNTQLASLGVGTAASGTAGEIRATNNITAYYSDDRLKTRLGNIEDALAKVRTLSGFYYEANETAQALGYEAVREVGVSAQQVQAVQPEIVVPAPIDDKYLTVRYERLVPLLIEAIKELDGELQSIKAQLKG